MGQTWERSSQPESARRTVSRAAGPDRSSGVRHGMVASAGFSSPENFSGPTSKMAPPRKPLDSASQTSRTTRMEPLEWLACSLLASARAALRSFNASTNVQEALTFFFRKTS